MYLIKEKFEVFRRGQFGMKCISTLIQEKTKDKTGEINILRKCYYNSLIKDFILAFCLLRYGLISIGVPGLTDFHTKSMSLSLRAMHPLVQLKSWTMSENRPYPFFWPWIMISPPGSMPRFLASSRSFAFGYEM